MQELIKIQEYKGNRAVDARDLHYFLNSKQHFSDWIKARLDKYNFDLDIDYSVHKFMNAYKVEQVDYYLTLDTAKEISMVENNDKGKQARRYFIECERQIKQINHQVNIIPQTLPEALRLAADLAEQNQKLLPKAEIYDQYINADNYKSIGTVAKVLGTGQNRLFKILRDSQILMRNNIPYQEYIEAGYFIVKEKPLKMGDLNYNYSQTFVTAKGEEYITRKILNKI